MSGFRRYVSGWVIAAALSVVTGAQAEPARLTWHAPAECPPETALRAEVARLLGAAALEAGGFDATAQVTAADAGRFNLVLSIHSAAGEGTRTLSAQTCESLLKVAAFSIALAVNPELATTTTNGSFEAPGDEVPPSAPLPPPAPPPPPQAQPLAATSNAPVAPPSPSSDAPSPPPELWLGARVVGDTSLLPSPALGAGVTVDAVLLGAWRFGVAGQVFIPQKELLSGGSGGLFTLWSLEGHACYEIRLRVRLSFCPLVQWGFVHGTGRGVDQELEQGSTVLAPGGAVVGRLALSRRMSAVLGASGLFPLSYDRFVVTAGQVHEIPVFSAQGTIGVEIRAF